MRTAVISISTTKDDAAKDEGLLVLEKRAVGVGAEIVAAETIPDDPTLIGRRLKHWADEFDCELILTTGGTGLHPDDHTPEATASVIDKPVPGIAEAMRLMTHKHTENALLSRGIAGIRGRTLIVNFPGRPSAIEECFDVVAGLLPTAVGACEHGYSSKQV